MVCLDRRARDLAGGGVDPRGDVAGDGRRTAVVDRRDRRRGRLPRRPRETGAEDRVDHRPGPSSRPATSPPRPRSQKPSDSGGSANAVGASIAVGGGFAEAREVRRGVVAQLIRGPEEQDLDLEADLGEEARRDQAVAAVVALAADDPHGALGPQRRHRLRHRAARRLHQREGVDTLVLDRPGVGSPHALGVVETSQPRLHRLNLPARRRGYFDTPMITFAVVVEPSDSVPLAR